MSTPSPFMTWIDYLPEVGDPIRAARDELKRMSAEALLSEGRAADLRAKVAEGQRELLQRVMQHWTLADIQAASETASRLDPAVSSTAEPFSQVSFEHIGARDNWMLASEALEIFHAGVLVQHDLHSTIGDEQRAKAIAGVLTWWNQVAKPVCERLAMQDRLAVAGERVEPLGRQREPVEAVPDVLALLTSPSVSFWLKDALQAALKRDPVDAANDAEMLAAVLAARCTEHGAASQPRPLAH